MSRLLLQILLGCWATVSALGAAAGAGTAAMAEANRQFEAGDFAAAAAGYEQVLAAQGPRASVFYNLGNSYQRLARYGPAILAYERARLLTPRDPDLLANLALARKSAAVFAEPARFPRLDGPLHYLSRNEWSLSVAGAALFLGAMAVGVAVTGLPRRGWRQAAAASVALAALVLGAGAGALHLRRGEADAGIVLTQDAAVRLSPFADAESLGTLDEGRRVRLGGHHGGFHQVEVAGTVLQGWMAAKDVAPITPRGDR